jgi:hypothetical protein
MALVRATISPISPYTDDHSRVHTAKADTITGAEGVEDTIEMPRGSNTLRTGARLVSLGARGAGSEPGEEGP